MQSEADEIQVNFFVLCDQVITEAQTNKQSLIGIYSALMTDQLPMQVNIGAAIGIRVQSSRPRVLTFRLTDPNGNQVFSSPPLPTNWASVEHGLQSAGFATIQIGLNLRSIPFHQTGLYTATLYTATLYADGALLATYPLSVLPAAPSRV